MLRDSESTTRHLGDGGCHLGDLQILLVRAGTALPGHLRQPLGGLVQLPHAFADMPNEFPQPLSHEADAGLQLPELIASTDLWGVTEVAAGNAVGKCQRLPQRQDDLPRDHPGCNQAAAEREHTGDGQQSVGLSRLTVTQFHLVLAKRSA
ncbi:hypothetical protein D3C85_1141570 [compost metagenome]